MPVKTHFKVLSTSAVAVAMLSLGLNVWWRSDKTVAYRVISPAYADDNQGNQNNQDNGSPNTAQCGKQDTPEDGLQGQIPLPDRLSGFKGFNCNLTKTASVQPSRGPGQWSQFALAHDHAGHICGYSGGAYILTAPGTIVVDLTDPNNAVQTEILQTAAMTGPGEGLRAHSGRGLLVSGHYELQVPNSGPNAHGFDIYDIGTDCRHPKLLSSTSSISFDTTGLPQYPGGGAWPNPDQVYGHEGGLAPDGMTFYLSDVPHALYHAIDISDPKNPQLLASFQNPFMTRSPGKGQGGDHGVSVSTDGKRAYFASTADDLTGPLPPATGPWFNGFVIADTSEIQARKPNAKIRFISSEYWNDGAVTQMTIPVKIKDKHYLITSEEFGVGQANTNGIKAACAAGRTPFGMVRIHDIEDERVPKEITKIILEANDPKNCPLISPEVTAQNGFGFMYDVHMCSVDNREEATTLACGYFQSGIRVYDIRNPKQPKEIAYFVPAALTKPGIGCGAIPILDAKKGMLYSTCSDSGVLSLKFREKVWPFEDSKTPRDKQL
jgi:hypothetical protein